MTEAQLCVSALVEVRRRSRVLQFGDSRVNLESASVWRLSAALDSDGSSFLLVFFSRSKSISHREKGVALADAHHRRLIDRRVGRAHARLRGGGRVYDFE